MNLFNQQSQLFMVAAFCLLIGVGFLYLALGLYGMLLNRVLKLFGVHAAACQYIYRNRRTWWARIATWFDRFLEDRLQ